ncbi:ATP-binding protein [Campylobacter helveticus]|uniref:ATP-binding protein n=1 Tax=Campylobacter helveticus TaxID=28898 RepID=A0ABY3L3S1_9BACT|nr:AAA family ATPase [Campylobacter helveticus]MCR2040270.1 ATP-binding protein [Campylobacter helveticus]TXK60628.1 ATP-binding protein [Campylobacter helveticus]
MIFIIGGESHTGKSLLAQNLLRKTSFPYLSLDLIKMGFVKLKNPPFKVDEDEKIANFFAPFLNNFIQSALENQQNYIIEGVYLRPKKLQKWLKNDECKILFFYFFLRRILNKIMR